MPMSAVIPCVNLNISVAEIGTNGSSGTIPLPWRRKVVFSRICHRWKLNRTFSQGVPPEGAGANFGSSKSNMALGDNFENYVFNILTLIFEWFVVYWGLFDGEFWDIFYLKNFTLSQERPFVCRK